MTGSESKQVGAEADAVWLRFVGSLKVANECEAGFGLDVGTMRRYLVWVRINATQTAHTVVYADNDLMAKLVAEAQYGAGNVLNWTEDTSDA